MSVLGRIQFKNPKNCSFWLDIVFFILATWPSSEQISIEILFKGIIVVKRYWNKPIFCELNKTHHHDYHHRRNTTNNQLTKHIRSTGYVSKSFKLVETSFQKLPWNELFPLQLENLFQISTPFNGKAKHKSSNITKSSVKYLQPVAINHHRCHLPKQKPTIPLPDAWNRHVTATRSNTTTARNVMSNFFLLFHFSVCSYEKTSASAGSNARISDTIRHLKRKCACGSALWR